MVLKHVETDVSKNFYGATIVYGLMMGVRDKEKGKSV